MLVTTNNAKDITMDNKQATSTDLAYLAGIIDGEGWIGLQKRLQKRWTTFKPALRVTNTDSNIINRVYEIWESIGVSGHIYENEQNPSVPNGKQIMNLQLNKRVDIQKVLEQVIPYLVGKKARAIMLVRYLTNTVDKDEAYESIKSMNRKGMRESSETTREAPELVLG
jgi:LAGLIDADG-like domain